MTPSSAPASEIPVLRLWSRHQELPGLSCGCLRFLLGSFQLLLLLLLQKARKTKDELLNALSEHALQSVRLLEFGELA